MLSSSSIIKNTCVDLDGNVEIDTHYDVTNKVNVEENHDNLCHTNVETQGQYLKNDHEHMFKELGKSIIKNAQEKSKLIVDKAKEQAEIIKSSSRDEGYKVGYDEGYERAYKEAITKAETEKQALIEQGEKVLNSCKEDYEKYFQSHEKDIIDCILNITGKIIHREICNEGTISTMIQEELEKICQNKTVIIKANPCYEKEIKKSIEKWKVECVIDNLFFIPIDTMEEGKVLIEKDQGKIRIDVDYALDKIKAELTK